MSQNKYTTNNKSTLVAVSSADGETPVYLYADPVTHGLVTGASGGGGAVTIADGADVAEGATTDAAVTAGSTGTVSGKLRQISADIATSNTLMATSANQTNGTQQTKLTDGTNVVNVLKSDGTAAGQNAGLVAGTYMSVPFTTTTVQAVGTTDVGNYRWVSVHTNTQGTSSAIAFQGSNDGTNWVGVSLNNVANVGSNTPAASTTGANRADAGPLSLRYFRLNVTGISAGTTAGTIVFSAMPTVNQPSLSAVSQSGTWTVGSNSATGAAVPANAFYMGVRDNGGNLSGLATSVSASDGNAGNASLLTGSQIFNGATFDRLRNNTSGAIIAAGTTITTTGTTITTYNASKLMVVVNIASGAGTVTLAINGTTSSGYSTNLLTSTALVGAGATALRIFPGATPSPNLVANDMIPRNLSFTATVVGSITYGIDYVLSL